MIFFANSDPGLRRPVNEDTCVSHKLADGRFFCAVFDGMGGTRGGEVASRLAADSFLFVMRNARPREKSGALLLRALEWADIVVREKADESPTLHGMGTTVTAVLLDGQTADILNVGDSRAYLFSAGKLRRLTRDDSYVEMLVECGMLTPAGARTHPRRHVITRAIGALDNQSIFPGNFLLCPKDRLLLCTDGLHGLVEDGRISRILAQNLPPAETVGYLIAAANENGGRDNITAAILEL